MFTKGTLHGKTTSFCRNLSFFWRRVWDSNPRGITPKRFSRPPRYDRFDNPPYIIVAEIPVSSLLFVSAAPRYALLRCPKCSARFRSQHFDRGHAFLLAPPATRSARKRLRFDNPPYIIVAEMPVSSLLFISAALANSSTSITLPAKIPTGERAEQSFILYTPGALLVNNFKNISEKSVFALAIPEKIW